METQSGTRPIAASHAFDPARLAPWLAQHVAGFVGPLQITQFKGGQSNPTYLLKTPERSYVMRSKPGPADRLLPSAHAIEREFRIMQALQGSAVPVARMDALCEDESVIGRAFYVMDFVEGRILWDQTLPEVPKAARAAHWDELNRVLAALHAIDPNEVGLSDYGKPGSYFERQIARWSRQYQASVTEPIEAMERLMPWLAANLPASARDDSRPAIVHGDYRLDNVIFHPTEPKILAVLDWELSTLGHPLADFSYHCMGWHVPLATGRGFGGCGPVELGLPTEADYIARYLSRLPGRFDADALAADWNFYLAYNLFRVAAILQGIERRCVDGTAASAQARQAGALARPLAELGWSYAQRA